MCLLKILSSSSKIVIINLLHISSDFPLSDTDTGPYRILLAFGHRITLTTTIVTATAGSGGNVSDNIFRITSAYREIYATIREVDQCEQLKGQPKDYKDHRKIIEKQSELLARTNDLLFIEIANSPLNSELLDALNKNVQTILSIVR